MPGKRKSIGSSSGEPKSKRAAKLDEIRKKVKNGFGAEDKARVEAFKAKRRGEDIVPSPARNALKSTPSKSSKASTTKKQAVASSLSSSPLKKRVPTKQKNQSVAAARANAQKVSGTPSSTTTKTAPIASVQAFSQPSALLQSPPHHHAFGAMPNQMGFGVNSSYGMPSPHQQFSFIQNPQMMNAMVQSGWNGGAVNGGFSPSQNAFAAVPAFQNAMIGIPSSAASPPLQAPAPARKPNSSQRKTAPSKSNVTFEEEEEEEGPPSFNEQSDIARKVMENATSDPSKPPPHQAPAPQVVDPESDEDITNDFIENENTDIAAEEEIPTNNHHSMKYSAGIAMSAVLLGIALTTKSSDMGGKDDSSSPPPSGKAEVLDKEKCFVNDSELPVDVCGDDFDVRVCPPDATCNNGKLLSCKNSFYAVFGDTCKPQKDAEKMIKLLGTELENKYKNRDSCDPFDRPNFSYEDIRQLHAGLLPKENGDLVDLLEWSEKFMLQNAKGKLAISFPPDHPAHELSLGCKLANFSKKSLDYTGNIIISGGAAAYSGSVSFASAHPFIAPFIALGLLFAVVSASIVTKNRIKKKVAKRRLDREVTVAFNKIVDILERNPAEVHQGVHLRDKIKAEIYGSHDQSHFTEHVFTRVGTRIRKDSRIDKTSKKVNGKDREFWQYVAVPNKKAKRAWWRFW